MAPPVTPLPRERADRRGSPDGPDGPAPRVDRRAAARSVAPFVTLGRRARPVGPAAERALPVAAALAPLLPGGELPRGASVSVAGPGATSLALGLVAAASAAGSWTAIVGCPDLGLVAAVEAGLDPDRVVAVAPPPPDRWGAVVAALVEALDVVLVRPSGRVGEADGRRLAARLRARGGVLVRLPGPGGWPAGADLALRTSRPVWQGAVGVDRADGAGRLRARRLVVGATGRGRAAHPRRVELWLPGPDGTPVAGPAADGPAPHPADGVPAAGAGAPIVAPRGGPPDGAAAWAHAG